MTGKKGIDVSAHQGTIDWDKVQRSGVTFAILRAGYGNDISQKDPTFDKNLREAQRRNIPCGAYWFSYAVSESDAKKEAKTCIKALGGARLEYPVYFDFEYDSVRYASEHGVTVTKKLATAMAKAFLEELEKAGYTAGYYANPDYLSRFFDDRQLKKYELWLACWSEKMPESRAGLWQYSDSGAVGGVLEKPTWIGLSWTIRSESKRPGKTASRSRFPKLWRSSRPPRKRRNPPYLPAKQRRQKRRSPLPKAGKQLRQHLKNPQRRRAMRP